MAGDERNQIGQRIAQARRQKGYTQKQMAEIVGVSARMMRNIEAGARGPYKYLAQISEATAKPLEWFHGVAFGDQSREMAKLRDRVAELESKVDGLASQRDEDGEDLRVSRNVPLQTGPREPKPDIRLDCILEGEGGSDWEAVFKDAGVHLGTSVRPVEVVMRFDPNGGKNPFERDPGWTSSYKYRLIVERFIPKRPR
jgi:transcriptional regulator with XRE-family HTH domain